MHPDQHGFQSVFICVPLWLFTGSVCLAQTAPLPAPAIVGPLSFPEQTTVDAGPLGKLNINGVLGGMGLVQANPVPCDDSQRAILANVQVFIQKTSGWWQFYVQAGAYDLPSLGLPLLSAPDTVSGLYGPVPVAYLKLAPTKHTSVLVGALPALMGAEYTFTFQNMDIERGLLWNQENSVNRGIQVDQTVGKFSASLSWNDGYYSNRYSWLSGSLTYTSGPHSVAFSGMGNLSQTRFQTLATPVQNNSAMYALIYTYTKDAWIVQPYVQTSEVPTGPAIGIQHGAGTYGGALLVNRTLGRGFTLAARGEYITTTGAAAEHAVNLLYGPGSAAWSLTLTPTFQSHAFFVRGEFSFVRASTYTPGGAFGPLGRNRNQPRGMIEAGFML